MLEGQTVRQRSGLLISPEHIPQGVDMSHCGEAKALAQPISYTTHSCLAPTSCGPSPSPCPEAAMGLGGQAMKYYLGISGGTEGV
ncbi:hypothetical protein E2C01_020806 [Portunus trituberculatus]|uniref:Uncharacterized protein n=1 Tax=Portunus trituberculatus TaxID=210409 RepID=A0A5B7E0X3_PORTR|nr:hypothetical protein [Portunus trituberculatus]